MRGPRLKICDGVSSAVYHCMSRTVDGAHLFGDREKEVLRRMLWQAADFSGVEVLTYVVMDNHFHVLVRVPPSRASAGSGQGISDEELMRRWRRLYPKPTKYETITAAVMERTLAVGGERADAIRRRLFARMGDVSEFMKTLKQRFTIWFNQNHDRYGPLWADRFKSVLVEGRGNPLQTIAAYIDLNPVRAGLVSDPKDYRFCGYAEAVARSGAGPFEGRGEEVHPEDSGPAYSAGSASVCADEQMEQPSHRSSERALSANSRGLKNGVVPWTALDGLCYVWCAYAGGAARGTVSPTEALQMHREFVFGKRAGEAELSEAERKRALDVLEKRGGMLPRSTVLRCRVRYFTDGVILGSQDYVCSFVESWQRDKQRKHRPKPVRLRGADWKGLAVMQPLRRQVFG
ncbi:MAG: transposase [Opitutales bacterium]